MVTGIKVGAEVVSSDDPITSPLNVEHSLSRNLVLFPLRNSVRRDADSLCKLLLGAQVPEDSSKCSVVHMSDVLHSRLNNINPGFIAGSKPAADNKQMVDTPRPEHYPSFNAWLEATRKAFGVRKGDLATVAGVSAQAVSKWLKGGDVGAVPLRKLADWAGVPYSDLRMLLEGQPIRDAKPRKGLPTPSPAVQRLSRKIQILAPDSHSLTAVEVLVDTFLAQSSRKQKGE